MQLKEYINTFKNTQNLKSFSLKLGVSHLYVYQIASHYRIPSPRLAVAIEKETGGLVSRYELRPDAKEIWD